MKNFLIVSIIMVQGLSAWTLLWDKTYPSSGQSGGAIIYDAVIDNNHNVYVTGCINKNIVTIKYNQYGDTLWSNSWGMTNYTGQGLSICLDADTNPCVAGMSILGTTNYKLTVIKYHKNNNGDTFWVRIDTLNPTGMNQYKLKIAVDANNNFYVASKNGVNCWLRKYNSSGTRQWGYTYL